MLNAEVIIKTRCELGEGPLWDEREQCFYWVDILPGKIHRYDPAGGDHQVYDVGEMIGTIGLRENGGLVVAVRSGFAYFDISTETLTPITDPEADKPDNRFNDGKPSPDGGFFAGTMAVSGAEGAGALYYLSQAGDVKKVVDNVSISNGIAWSIDLKTMYYIDSTPKKVYAFDYDASNGEVSNQRLCIQVAEELGSPDGMCIDTEGKLWIAHFGGGCVRRWDPETGAILETVSVPTQKVTCAVFGGANMDTLYITTAAMGTDAINDPLAGCLFSVKLPFK
ncbi:MAG: SMP-30/gluconolactonase/LRE family protein, partial [Aggregatilineales bacterium]